MRALLWKDYRVNRLVLGVGVVLLLAPYVIALLLAWRGDMRAPSAPGLTPIEFALFAASLYSLGLSQLTLALLGGNVIACERVDGSAEFLAYLPPSRARIIASKAILALATGLVIWGSNLLVFYSIMPDVPTLPRSDFHWGLVLQGIAATGLVMFGLGWLGSSFLASPTFAVAVGLPSPLVIVMLLQASSFYLGWPAMEDLSSTYSACCLTLGLLGLAAGTWYYLRRVEP